MKKKKKEKRIRKRQIDSFMFHILKIVTAIHDCILCTMFPLLTGFDWFGYKIFMSFYKMKYFPYLGVPILVRFQVELYFFK